MKFYISILLILSALLFSNTTDYNIPREDTLEGFTYVGELNNHYYYYSDNPYEWRDAKIFLLV